MIGVVARAPCCDDHRLSLKAAARCSTTQFGMFIDRKEVGGPNEFARMSDEELDVFLREYIEASSLLHNGRSKH